MTTVATRAEEATSASAASADCLAAHRRLVKESLEIMRRLPLRAENITDLFRIGCSCLEVASQSAFAARSEAEALHYWEQAALGERQLRKATYHALREGHVNNAIYDRLFTIANLARRARHDEIVRVRRRLRQLALI